jgi:hypothetical protein
MKRRNCIKKNKNSYLRYKCKKLSFIARTGLKYDRGTRMKALRDFSTVVYIQFFSLLDTLKPFLIIIINQIILSDATGPSCHFLTVGIKIVYVNQ